VFLVSTSVSVLVQLCDLLGVPPSESVPVRQVAPSRSATFSPSTVRSFRSPDSGLSLFSASFCFQCIRIRLIGMLGGFYVTLRANRRASTPAFDSYLAIDFGLPLSSEIAVPSVKFIHVSVSVQCPVVASSSSSSLAFDSRLRFSPSFPVGFPVSLVLPGMSAFSVRPTSDSVRSSSALFQFSVSVSVLRLGSSTPRFRIQIPVHPCLRYSVKVVHVFVSSNSGSSLFRLQCKGCPRLCFSSSCHSSCLRQSRLVS
jgi:hypothetical protein